MTMTKIQNSRALPKSHRILSCLVLVNEDVVDQRKVTTPTHLHLKRSRLKNPKWRNKRKGKTKPKQPKQRKDNLRRPKMRLKNRGKGKAYLYIEYIPTCSGIGGGT